jgi:hypothetical protein
MEIETTSSSCGLNDELTFDGSSYNLNFLNSTSLELSRVVGCIGSVDDSNLMKTSYLLPWKSLWLTIMNKLSEIRSAGSYLEYFYYYTSVIRMHVEYQIQLSSFCFYSLLFCTEPDLINDLFDLNLVHKKEVD